MHLPNNDVQPMAYNVPGRSFPIQNLVVAIPAASHTLWEKYSVWFVTNVWKETVATV
jgi:hypothetical protein